jgi:hypothetical protein
MNKTVITAIMVAIIFGGGGYYFGTQQAASSTTPTGAAAFAGRTGGAGRFGGGAAGGGFTTGTIISTGSGTMTIQMPTSTSTSATTGTKIVLFDSNTVVSELQTVPVSNLAVGQSVTVSGTANSDGSVTATSIQVRPARTGGPATTQGLMQSYSGSNGQ